MGKLLAFFGLGIPIKYVDQFRMDEVLLNIWPSNEILVIV